MSDLINGRTPEEIKAALRFCSEICFGRTDCPYYDGVNERCQTKLTADTLALIECFESERDAMKATLDRLGNFGKLFADYAGCPRGAMGRMGGVPIQEEVLAMKPITDADGGRWIPVNADALHELVEKFTAPLSKDMVSVVRCEDCRYGHPCWLDNMQDGPPHCVVCSKHGNGVTTADFFCMCGEKKEGD